MLPGVFRSLNVVIFDVLQDDYTVAATYGTGSSSKFAATMAAHTTAESNAQLLADNNFRLLDSATKQSTAVSLRLFADRLEYAALKIDDTSSDQTGHDGGGGPNMLSHNPNSRSTARLDPLERDKVAAISANGSILRTCDILRTEAGYGGASRSSFTIIAYVHPVASSFCGMCCVGSEKREERVRRVLHFVRDPRGDAVSVAVHAQSAGRDSVSGADRGGAPTTAEAAGAVITSGASVSAVSNRAAHVTALWAAAINRVAAAAGASAIGGAAVVGVAGQPLTQQQLLVRLGLGDCCPAADASSIYGDGAGASGTAGGLLAHLYNVQPLPLSLISSSTSASSRRLLVFLCPASGKGQAVTLYKQFAHPIFMDAGCDCEEIVTTTAGQATHDLRNMPWDRLSRYDGIVVCGGDGAVSEVVNGLMSRVTGDWQRAVQKCPIGVLPGGSGNGLACSLLHASGLEYSVANAAMIIAKGRIQRMDVASAFVLGSQPIAAPVTVSTSVSVATTAVDSGALVVPPSDGRPPIHLRPQPYACSSETGASSVTATAAASLNGTTASAGTLTRHQTPAPLLGAQGSSIKYINDDAASVGHVSPLSAVAISVAGGGEAAATANGQHHQHQQHGHAKPPLQQHALAPLSSRPGLWGAHHYSFLSTEWAIVADIDIESEKLRFLGDARFDCYGAIRGCFLRRYRGRFCFLPADPSQRSGRAWSEAGAVTSSRADSTTHTTDLEAATTGGGGVDTSPLPSPSSAASAAAASAGPVIAGGVGTDSGNAVESRGHTSHHAPHTSPPPSINHLQPFDHPVPLSWRSIEGVFTFMWITMTSHQSVGVSCPGVGSHAQHHHSSSGGSDGDHRHHFNAPPRPGSTGAVIDHGDDDDGSLHHHPDSSSTAGLDSGIFTVTLVRDTSPLNMIKILLALDDKGSISKCSGVEVYRCTAWRLEPVVDDGGDGPSGAPASHGNLRGRSNSSSIRYGGSPAPSTAAASAATSTATASTASKAALRGGGGGASSLSPSKSSSGGGHICLDGEAVPYGPVQAEAHRGLLRVFA